MKAVEINVIPHRKQRYPTAGDWIIKNDVIKINVSKTGDKYMDALIYVHELIETLVATRQGISEEDVTAFDKAFEDERSKGWQTPDAEPGDDHRAPYRDAHGFATCIERLLCDKLGIDWQAYEQRIQTL